MSTLYPTLFSEGKLAGVTLRNRIAMAPLTRQMAQSDGTPTDEMVAYYARRARGGIGLIITEGTYETDELACRTYLSQPGIANDKHVAGWRKVVDAIHEQGAACIAQLMHGGRVVDPRCLAAGESPLTASDTQSDGWVLYTDTDDEKHIRNIDGDWPKVTFGPAKAMTAEQMERVAQGFADGAKRAVEAGFDGVEIHGANGYLLYQFIHPSTNLRTDEYGGSAENRVRFPKMVCQKVRDAIGPDKIITLRLSQDGVDDFMGSWPGGVEDARAIGVALADAAVDALHWSSFDYTDNRDPNSDVPMSNAIKEASGKPVIVNGGIAEGAQAESALTSGAGDFVAIGRPLFTQPDWAFIVRSGMPYNWSEFDRKYVIQPAVDLDKSYPAVIEDPMWPAFK